MIKSFYLVILIFMLITTLSRGFVHLLDLAACLSLVQPRQSATHIHGNKLDLVVARGTDVDISCINKVPVSDHFCVFPLFYIK